MLIAAFVTLAGLLSPQQSSSSPPTAKTPPAHAAPVAAETNDFWPVLCLKNRDVAVNPVDGSTTEVPADAGAVWSRDRRIRAFIAPAAAPDGRGRPEIFAARSPKVDHPAPPMQVTRGAANPRLVGWRADGRTLVYGAGERGHARLYEIVPETPGNDAPVAKPFTDDIGDLAEAEIGPDNTVYYYRIRSFRGKERVGDVMRLSKGQFDTVLPDADVRSLALSPDGRHLSVGRIGRITIYDMTEPRKVVREIAFPEIDEKLYAHLAGVMAWRPDGKQLVARITFAGGRMVADLNAEPEPMAGDRQLFIIPLEGKVRTVSYGAAAGGHADELRWTAPPTAIERRSVH